MAAAKRFIAGFGRASPLTSTRPPRDPPCPLHPRQRQIREMPHQRPGRASP